MNPDAASNELSVTKRKVIAHVSLCSGCCCGNVARGKPEVPLERLKQEWKSNGLSKSVQLTVSGCLGPCDLVNVVRISSEGDDVWLGNLRTNDDYLELVAWAIECKTSGRAAPLSQHINACRFNPFLVSALA